jgi:hypothetical protein
MMRSDPLDQPFLPLIGQIYMVRTHILFALDKHLMRPVVVNRTAAIQHGRITVVTRTSDTKAPGIPHRKNAMLGLTKDGVFTRQNSTEAQR